MKLFNEKIMRFLKFGLVGGSGTIINFLVFILLSNLTKNNFLVDWIFPAIAFELAMLNNYLLSYFWVWRERKRPFFPGLLKYNASALVAFFANYFAFQAMRILFQVSKESNWLLYYFFYALGIGIGMIINFLFSEFVIFKKKNEKNGSPQV